MKKKEEKECKWGHILQLYKTGTLYRPVSRTPKAKKLVSVLVTFTSITGLRTEALEHISYIYYQVSFKKDTTKVQGFIDSRSEIITIAPAYAKKLGLRVWIINIAAPKINESTLETYGMVIVGFQVYNKFGKARFFQETFLVADTGVKIVLEILFLILNKVKVDFTERELTWKAYTIAEALPTTKRVKIIGPE